MCAKAAIKLIRYLMVPAESTFTVKAFAEGLFAAFGHDPVISVKEFSGELQFAEVTFENASVKLAVNANALTVINVNSTDRQEIEHTMRAQVLETTRYAEVVFTSSDISVARVKEGHYSAQVNGVLTLHGVTKQLRLSGELWMTNETLRVKGKSAVKQTEFKITPVSVAAGTLRVKNEVKCSFDVVARRDTSFRDDTGIREN